MTQLHPKDQENRKQNRFSERRFSGKKSYTTGWMEKRGVAYCSKDLPGNNAQFVSVDLTGKKNQVILE